MALDKTLLAGSSATLVLKLLDGRDMYGYQIIEELACRSNNVFQMKAGTLYPLLHGLEKKGLLESYEEHADSARVRKYYRLTQKGKKFLQEKRKRVRHFLASWKAAALKHVNGFFGQSWRPGAWIILMPPKNLEPAFPFLIFLKKKV